MTVSSFQRTVLPRTVLPRTVFRTALTMLPAAVAALAGILVSGCGGSAASSAHPGADKAESIARPPAPIVTDPSETFNVTIYATNGQFLVDKLEIEFNRRRGIHEFYGFYRDAYSEMKRIPFRDLVRVEFLGEMPPALFDQAIVGREQMNLRQDQAFTVRLTFKDQSQREFFALIPKFRGEKDLELWEYNMSNKNQTIERIEFDR
jgi:hypothetical protein